MSASETEYHSQSLKILDEMRELYTENKVFYQAEAFSEYEDVQVKFMDAIKDEYDTETRCEAIDDLGRFNFDEVEQILTEGEMQ